MASKKRKKGGTPPLDLNTQILIEIRDELTQVKAEIHDMKGYMEQLNRLRVESETRLATALLDLRQVTNETNTLIKGLRQDARIQELQDRVEKLEKKSA